MNIRKTISEIIFGNVNDRPPKQIESFLQPKDRVLDLGAGSCLNTKILRDRGYSVLPVDIKNKSVYKDIPSQVYDGKHLPFKNNAFDVCLLLSVLHHTQDPEAVLKEAIRVSKKLVVYEDAITNRFQRFYTYVIDSVLNQELVAPHTNKTDNEWRQLFKKLRLKLVNSTYRKSWLFLHNPMYFLKKT